MEGQLKTSGSEKIHLLFCAYVCNRWEQQMSQVVTSELPSFSVNQNIRLWFLPDELIIISKLHTAPLAFSSLKNNSWSLAWTSALCLVQGTVLDTGLIEPSDPFLPQLRPLRPLLSWTVCKQPSLSTAVLPNLPLPLKPEPFSLLWDPYSCNPEDKNLIWQMRPFLTQKLHQGFSSFFNFSLKHSCPSQAAPISSL